MNKVLHNPRARIAVLAALVVGGVFFLMRRGSSSNPLDNLPVAPDVSGAAGTGLDIGSTGGTAGGVPLDATQTGSTDLFPDNKLRLAAMDLIDQIRGISDQLASGVPIDGGTFPIGDGSFGGGGASNPTDSTNISGDGSPAAPGNAIAMAPGGGWYSPGWEDPAVQANLVQVGQEYARTHPGWATPDFRINPTATPRPLSRPPSRPSSRPPTWIRFNFATRRFQSAAPRAYGGRVTGFAPMFGFSRTAVSYSGARIVTRPAVAPRPGPYFSRTATYAAPGANARPFFSPLQARTVVTPRRQV